MYDNLITSISPKVCKNISKSDCLTLCTSLFKGSSSKLLNQNLIQQKHDRTRHSCRYMHCICYWVGQNPRLFFLSL